MRWFKHYSDASDDDFIEGLEDKFGLEGYARWWKMLEIIARSMDKTGNCSVAHSWVKWQSFLKGKRNKLETFLEHCQNESRITLKLNGNILEIKCPNLLKLKDEYNSKSGHVEDNTPDTLPTPIKEIDIDKERREEEAKPHAEFLKIIQAFDDCRAEVFGEQNRRPYPAPDDSDFAKRFIVAGYTIDDCRTVFKNRFLACSVARKRPIDRLGYFEKPLEDFFKNKLDRDKTPMAKKPPDYKKPIKGRSTRDPEFLKSLEDENYDRPDSLPQQPPERAASAGVSF